MITLNPRRCPMRKICGFDPGCGSTSAMSLLDLCQCPEVIASSFCILSACSRGQDVEPSLINHSVTNYCVFPGSQEFQAGHSGDAMGFCESFQIPWEGIACPYVPSAQPSVSFLSWSLKRTNLLSVPFSQQTSLGTNYVRKD